MGTTNLSFTKVNVLRVRKTTDVGNSLNNIGNNLDNLDNLLEDFTKFEVSLEEGLEVTSEVSVVSINRVFKRNQLSVDVQRSLEKLSVNTEVEVEVTISNRTTSRDTTFSNLKDRKTTFSKNGGSSISLEGDITNFRSGSNIERPSHLNSNGSSDGDSNNTKNGELNFEDLEGLIEVRTGTRLAGSASKPRVINSQFVKIHDFLVI